MNLPEKFDTIDTSVQLLKDLQKAFRYKMLDFWSEYNNIFINEFNKEKIDLFITIKQIMITIENNRVLYHVYIDPEIYNHFSKEDEEHFVFIDNMNNIIDNILQELKNRRIFVMGQRIPRVKNNVGKKNAKLLSVKLLNEFKIYKKIFKDEFNLNFNLKEKDSFIELRYTSKDLFLDEKLLSTIFNLFKGNKFDTFAILPKYNDSDNVVNLDFILSKDK